MSEAVAETNVPTNEADLSAPTEAPRPDFTTATMLNESVTILQDLTACVKERGVSQADVAAVQQVLDDVKETIPDIDTKIGLERYQGMFTPEPSFLNHQVSIESFGEAVMKIITKLIEEGRKLAMQMYAWMKTLYRNLTSVEVKCQNLEGKILEIRKMYQFLDPQFRWDDRADAKAIAEAILQDPKLDRTFLQRAAFGEQEDWRTYEAAVTTVAQLVEQLEAKMGKSAALAEQGIADTAIFDNIIRNLGYAEETVQGFLQVNPAPRYHVLANPTFYANAPVYEPPSNNLDLEIIADAYKACDGHLAKLKKAKFERDRDAEDVQLLVVNLIKAMNILDQVIAVLAEMPKAQMKMLACHYNFFVKMISASQKRIIESNLSPEARSEQLKFLDAVVKAAR